MDTQIQYKGFTLIELLLYVSIASSLLFLSTLFLGELLESRVKNQTIAEVEQQGLQVMQQITQAVRNAESITSPGVAATSSALTLDVLPAGDDPTVFDLSSGTIRIQEGAGSPIALTNDRVEASLLTFENLSRTDTPGVVRVSFTLLYNSTSGRHEYIFSKSFSTSASLRQP